MKRASGVYVIDCCTGASREGFWSWIWFWVNGWRVIFIPWNGIKALVDVLGVENPDLWKWLSGQEQPPEALATNPVFTAVRNKVTSNLDNYAAPETRGTPGNPWVRGWDDIKKYKGGPITGNQ